MLRILFFLLILQLLYACSYDCGKSDGLKINFIDYAPVEIKSYTIKKYVKGSGFSSFIDSLVLDSSNISYKLSNDSLIAISSTGLVKLKSGFDYKVEIPYLNRSYEITELYEPQQKSKKGFLSTTKEYCVNAIRAGKVNGLPASIEFNSLYLRK